MKKRMLFSSILLLVSVLFVSNISAENYTQFSLPETATGRLGKGRISGNIAYSLDGTRLAVASSIGIWLYNAHTGTEIALLTGHTDVVNSVGYSPDGSTLVSGSADGTVRLWDAVTGAHQGLTVHERGVLSVAFSQDGDTFVSWDRVLSISPDGGTLARGSGQEISLSDAVTGHQKQQLTGHTSAVTSIAFSPDGSTLASGSEDKTIRLWDTVTGAYKGTLVGHRSSILSVTYSADGSTLASGSQDGTVFLWDAVTSAYKGTLAEHTDAVTSVAFSPDGGTLASGSKDNTIRLWDAITGAPKRSLTGHTSEVLSVAIGPNGGLLASGNRYGAVFLWDVATGTRRRTLTGHTSEVTSVALNPDGSTLASGSRGEIILWDAVTGAQKQTLRGHGHDYSVISIAFSVDGGALVSGNQRDFRLWNLLVGTSQQIATYNNRFTSVALSSDRGTIAGGGDDAIIRLRDVGEGYDKARLVGHASRITSVAFSSDGSTLASGSEDRTIRLWDAATGAHKRTFTGHTSSVLSVAFSADGDTLASGSTDGTILLWDLTPSTNADATVNILPSPVESPAIGEALTFSIDIADGENIAGYQATIQFDRTALRYVSSTNANYLPTGAFFVPPVVTGNRVTLAATALDGVNNGDGILATITFEVVAVKASVLTLFDVILSDSAGKSSQPRFKGALVVEPPRIVGDVNIDGVVNIQDLVLVASRFGQTGQNSADINGDGVVNIVDLVKVAGAFGAEVAAPAAHPQALTMLTATDVQGWLTQAQSLNLTDATLQRGILFLEQLLVALTPKETVLLPNYPNPFNPETWMPYHLAHAADVTLTIYNTKGVVVRQLDLGHQPAGFYTARAKAAYWNGCTENGELVASGIYFYQLRAGDYSALRRMVIVK